MMVRNSASVVGKARRVSKQSVDLIPEKPPVQILIFFLIIDEFLNEL
jgi:hypothetical protein